MKVQDVFGQIPVLETERVILRPLRAEDREDMFAYASDPEVTRYVSWYAHQTLEDTDEFINHVLKNYAEGQLAPWAIEDRESGKMIGTAGYLGWNLRHFRGEVGYALARPYWNRGIVTEAMGPVMQFGWDEMKLIRIESRCIPENIGSARVMEKLGMQYEGLLRKHLYTKGSFRDAKIYAAIRSVE